MTNKEDGKLARGATVLALALVIIVSMLATAVSAYADTREEGAPASEETTPVAIPEENDKVVIPPVPEDEALPDGTEVVALPEEDDGLSIPPPSEDIFARGPMVQSKVVDEDQDGVADGGSWVFERHVRVDRDGDGNYEYAMDLVIVWSWWDPDEDGTIEVWKWSFLFREYFDPNDDGIRELARGFRWEREVVDKDSDGNPERVTADRWFRLVLDVRTALTENPAVTKLSGIEAVTGTPVREEVRWQKWAGDGVPELVRAKHVSREVVDKDSDGNPEYATKARAGRTTIDRDSDGNPEYRRAHRDAVELFDRDDDGRWDAAHVTRAGYEVIDRDDDGTPEYEHKWSYDDWFYHGVPDRVLRAYDEDAEEDEGASEMPPMETLGL